MEHGDPTSIRFRGQEIAKLPHRERFNTLKRIAQIEEEQKLADILRDFPLYDIEQLHSAIRQMEVNIKRLQASQSEEHQKIREYRGLIARCEKRDKLLKDNGFG